MRQYLNMLMKDVGRLDLRVRVFQEVIHTIDITIHQTLSTEGIIMSDVGLGILKMMDLLVAILELAPPCQAILTDMGRMTRIIHLLAQGIVLQCQEALVLEDPCQIEVEEAHLSMMVVQTTVSMVCTTHLLDRLSRQSDKVEDLTSDSAFSLPLQIRFSHSKTNGMF